MKRTFRWIWSFADPLFVTAAGFVGAVLGLLGVIDAEVLSTVTLVVLTAVGATLIRARMSVDETNKTLGMLKPSVQALRESAEATMTKSPWIVVKNENSWDLHTADGSRATVRRRKVFRFTQNGILAVREHMGGEGTLHKHLDSPHREVGQISHDGRPYSIILLGRVCNRHEEESLEVGYDAHDAFTSSTEYITMLIEDETRELIVRVVWPSERPPKDLVLEEANLPARSVFDQLGREGERRSYEYRATHPVQGSQVTFRWSW